MCSGGAGMRHGSQETPLYCIICAIQVHYHTYSCGLANLWDGAWIFGTLSPSVKLAALFIYILCMKFIELTHIGEAMPICLPVCVFHHRNYWTYFEEFGIGRLRPIFVRRNWFWVVLIQYQFYLHQEKLQLCLNSLYYCIIYYRIWMKCVLSITICNIRPARSSRTDIENRCSSVPDSWSFCPVLFVLKLPD
jgi:hypothetical protein